MTYQQALEKIHSLDAFGSRPGLDRIKKFLDILGNPQNNLKFVHVAGTNGKGSTCALISSVLREAGLKTGLFISPYITDFCERIQINNKPIDGQLLADVVEETFPILLKLREEDCIITEFECVMALQFLIHSRENCDIVVLETGLGGLLDCTNVILPPVATVLTTIGLDHTGILGETIEEIAEQKCGIIKQNSPVITSLQEPAVMDIIEKTAKKNNSAVHKSSDIQIDVISQDINSTKFIYKGTEITLPLIGNHQIENGKTALAAIEVLQNSFDISAENIAKGFETAINPARFEVLCKAPFVILDGAHNPNGIEALKNAIETYVSTDKTICLMGMLSDKDSKSSVKLLSGLFSQVFTVPVSNPRSLSSEALAEECEPYFNKVTSYDNVFSAFDEAFATAKKENATLIICGSLYLAGEIRPYIIQKCKEQA